MRRFAHFFVFICVYVKIIVSLCPYYTSCDYFIHIVRLKGCYLPGEWSFGGLQLRGITADSVNDCDHNDATISYSAETYSAKKCARNIIGAREIFDIFQLKAVIITPPCKEGDT